MPLPTEEITKERLYNWMQKMKQSNATPILLVGIGHEQTSGQIVICTLDEPELRQETIREFLRYALKQLGG